MEDAVVRTIHGKYSVLAPILDERGRRLWAAVEARSLGRGGITWVAEATGMSRRRIHAGMAEIESAGAGGVEATGRQRLIANTTTGEGLSIEAEFDDGRYPTGVKVSDEELAGVRVRRSSFHGDWNYVILPRRKTT